MLKHPRVVRGDPAVHVPAHINYAQYVLDNLQQGGDKEAIINGETGESITFKQLVQNIVNVACGLHSLGLRKSDVVAIVSENRVEFLVTVLASISCGAVVSTANVIYTENELTHTLNISKPKYVFCSPLAIKTHSATFKKLPYIRTLIRYGGDPSQSGLPFDDLLRGHVDVSTFEPVDVLGQTDTATILCSSGTTGLPKGVMLTHLNLLVSAVQMNDSMYDSRGLIRFLTIVPWYHAYGYMSTINLLNANRTVVFLSRFQQDQYLDTIQKYKPNCLLAVPPMVVFLAKYPAVSRYDLSSVREIWCGAAPLSADLIQATKTRMPSVRSITQAYGMTETSLAATRDQMVEAGAKAGSGGSPVPGIRVKVVDLETREILGVRQKGEICVKGPHLMKGYVGDGTATREVMDEEGYLKTGDIGYYDEDNYFYIVDRMKELIKYKGFQVPPAEVEAVLLEHPGVAECGVVGAPDESAGELATAFVVRQPGAAVSEQELIDLVASKLSRAKQLHGGVVFVREVPKNPSGKILRRVLRERLQRPPSKL